MPPNIVTFLLTFPVVAASSAPRGSARTGAARSVFLLSCKQAHTHAATLNVCAARPDLYPESITCSFYKTCGAGARAGNAPSVPCVQTVFSCCLPPLQAQAAGAVLGRTQRKRCSLEYHYLTLFHFRTCLGSERKQLRCAGRVILFL